MMDNLPTNLSIIAIIIIKKSQENINYPMFLRYLNVSSLKKKRKNLQTNFLIHKNQFLYFFHLKKILFNFWSNFFNLFPPKCSILFSLQYLQFTSIIFSFYPSFHLVSSFPIFQYLPQKKNKKTNKQLKK